MVEASEKAMFFKWQCDQQHQGLQPNGSKWDEQKRLRIFTQKCDLCSRCMEEFSPKKPTLTSLVTGIIPKLASLQIFSG
jgi:hypothetical protein